MLPSDSVHFQEYIHRVGRTARGEGGKGHALLFLLPEELQFLRYLKVWASYPPKINPSLLLTGYLNNCMIHCPVRKPRCLWKNMSSMRRKFQICSLIWYQSVDIPVVAFAVLSLLCHELNSWRELAGENCGRKLLPESVCQRCIQVLYFGIQLALYEADLQCAPPQSEGTNKFPF